MRAISVPEKNAERAMRIKKNANDAGSIMKGKN